MIPSATGGDSSPFDRLLGVGDQVAAAAGGLALAGGLGQKAESLLSRASFLRPVSRLLANRSVGVGLLAVGIGSMLWNGLRATSRLLTGTTGDSTGDSLFAVGSGLGVASLSLSLFVEGSLLRGLPVSPILSLFQTGSVLGGTAVDLVDLSHRVRRYLEGDPEVGLGQVLVQGGLTVVFGFDHQTFEAAGRFCRSLAEIHVGVLATPEGVILPAIHPRNGNDEGGGARKSRRPAYPREVERVLSNTNVEGAEEILQDPLLLGAVMCAAGGVPRSLVFRWAESLRVRIQEKPLDLCYREEHLPLELEERMTQLARDMGDHLGPALRDKSWRTLFGTLSGPWRSQGGDLWLRGFVEAERMVWAAHSMYRTREVARSKAQTWWEKATVGPEIEFGWKTAIVPRTGRGFDQQRTDFVTELEKHLRADRHLKGAKFEPINAEPMDLQPEQTLIFPRIIDEFDLEIDGKVERVWLHVLQGTGGIIVDLKIGNRYVKEVPGTVSVTAFDSPGYIHSALEMNHEAALELLASMKGVPLDRLKQSLSRRAANRRTFYGHMVKDALGDIAYFEYNPQLRGLERENAKFLIGGDPNDSALFYDFDGTCGTFLQATEALKKGIINRTIGIIPLDDYIGLKVEVPGIGVRHIFLKSESHGNWELVCKEPFSLKKKEMDFYEAIYDFLRETRVSGTLDFNPVSFQVHAGIPYTDKDRHVSPQGLVHLMEHWCTVEGDLVAAFSPSPQRYIFMRPSEKEFRKMVANPRSHRLRRNRHNEKGGEEPLQDWIARVVDLFTKHTKPKYSSMNVDNYLWKLLKEADEQKVIRLEYGEMDPTSGNRPVYVYTTPHKESNEVPLATWTRGQRKEGIPTAEMRWPDTPMIQTEKGFVICPEGLRFLTEFWGSYVFAASHGLPELAEVFSPFQPSVFVAPPR